MRKATYLLTAVLLVLAFAVAPLVAQDYEPEESQLEQSVEETVQDVDEEVDSALDSIDEEADETASDINQAADEVGAELSEIDEELAGQEEEELAATDADVEMEEGEETLPATGSNLPLVAMLGLSLLGGAVAIRQLR